MSRALRGQAVGARGRGGNELRNPHETDCREVIDEVYLYLDGEIDTIAARLIRDHLDECAPCLRQFGIEQEVKLLVARCCGSDRAPEALRIRVLAAAHRAGRAGQRRSTAPSSSPGGAGAAAQPLPQRAPADR